MPSNKDGVMIVLSSPSGAGKTTLVNLLSKKDNYVISISHTTRNPRPGEINNKDYYFVNDNEFKRLIKNEEFLEYAKVFNNFYGTTRTPVIDNLNKGKNILFDIDWQGADQIKNKKLDFKLISFFILPPSKEVLFKRLSNRDMRDKLIAEERMKQFERDVLHWINYDYVIINDKIEKCYNKIDNLNKGKNVLFDIDWQGADQIKNKNLDFKLITFFILPPSKEILYERLSNRDMKDKLIAEERMKQFERDVLHWINYNYVVINDDLDTCYEKIQNLINAETNDGSKDYDLEFIRKHVEKLTS